MTSDLLNTARAHRAAGRFNEAIQACRQFLRENPASIEAAHLCGCACFDAGNVREALAILERTAHVQPGSAQAQLDFGLALQAAGKIPEAVSAYRRSLALHSENADVWCRLAVVLRRIRDWPQAEEAYHQALQRTPDLNEALLGLGWVLLELERWPEAEKKFRQSLGSDSRQAEAHYGLGLALKGAEKFALAADSFQQAIALRPRYLEALFALGNTLQAMEQWDAAAVVFKQALTAAPLSPEVISNYGNSLWGARDFEGALAAHREALRLRPEHAASYNNLGNALLGLLRYHEAETAFEKALALQPNQANTLCNLGNVQLAQNKLDSAMAFYGLALQTDPDFKQAVFNQSLVHLLRGDFKAGLPGYELRWILRRKKFVDEVPREQWQGQESLEGKTLLVCCEQGFGDTLQFVRYVPLLQARGAKVVLRVQRALRELLSCLPGVTFATAEDNELPAFDLYCLLLSMPLAFGTGLSTIPGSTPYLRAPEELTHRWRARLGSSEEARIGLVCSGNTAHRNDHNRSLPLSALRPLMNAEYGRYYFLQKEIRPAEETLLAATPEIEVLAGEIRDFCDTAAIIANLDLVVTVDTSVAHLAGAMGKPTWVLLPFAPDWRWMMERGDSPWYPSLRLFRQERPGDWGGVVTRVHAALAEFCENRRPLARA